MNRSERLLSIVSWGVALGLLALAAFLVWQAVSGTPAFASGGGRGQSLQAPLIEFNGDNSLISTPPAHLKPSQAAAAGFISRLSDLHTVIPNRARRDVLDYVVEQGDSVFEIAARFNITPETVLWANYDQLNDNPDLISPGMELVIPPVNGVLYRWQEGDTLDAVAGKFEARPEDVLDWPGNQLDLSNPAISAGSLVMLPGGHREFRQWLIPTIPRGAAGVSKSVYGAGACEGSYEGAYGTGTFIWPIGTHYLSGNDYWSGHLGIDLAAAQGAPVYASDAGVVVFAGWSNGGYGNTVMIDHGNGYQTLYGHLSSVAVSCGRSVGQGTVIAYAGSTGNSTGTHLHFEVRYLGGFINPWYVLPAP